MRHEQARRPTVIGCQPLTTPLERDQVVLPIEIGERQVRRESLLGHDEAELGRGLESSAFEEQLHWDALEAVVEPAPGRDAVHVAHHRLARQRQQLVVRDRERFVYEARHHEGPLGGVDTWDVAVVQDGPLGGQDLAGWHTITRGGQNYVLKDACSSRAGPSGHGKIEASSDSPKPRTTAATASSQFPAPVSFPTDVISPPGIPPGPTRSNGL